MNSEDELKKLIETVEGQEKQMDEEIQRLRKAEEQLNQARSGPESLSTKKPGNVPPHAPGLG